MGVAHSLRARQVERVRDIPYGAVTECFEGPWPEVRGKARIAFVGQLSERKGARAIGPLLHKLRTSFPEGIQLVVAGGGPLLEEVKDLFKGEPDVSVLGWIDHAGVVDLLRRSDIFLAPGMHDGWGLHVVEALSQGCLVVASSETTSGRSLLLNSRLGYLQPYRTLIDMEAELPDLGPIEQVRQQRSYRVKASIPFLTNAVVDRIVEAVSADEE